MRLFDWAKENADYGPLALRVGLGLTLLWFGVQELLNPGIFAAYLAPWLTPFIPIPLSAFLLINGIIDATFGLLLLIGYKVRLIGLLAAVHMTGIVLSVGYNEIGVRDFGLMLALLSLLFIGGGKCAIDNREEKSH